MQRIEGPFAFGHPVEVRFADIDIGGHAHHSKVLIYIEEARAAYWRQVAGRGGVEDIDYILASAEVRFRQRILYPDRLEVGVRVSRMGRKQFVMEYAVESPSRGLLATAVTVQVMYDYEVGASMEIPAELRDRIAAHEGGAVAEAEG